MDISPAGILRNTVLHVPRILATTALAALGLSPNAEHQDLLAEVFAAASRPVLGTPAALLASQAQFAVDHGVRGRIWISKVVIPRPASDDDQSGICCAVRAAIAHLGGGDERYVMPEVADVRAEWTGYRGAAFALSARPKADEREQYRRMMAEVDADAPTMLYLHGGAYCLGEPATHRFVTQALARDTRGRCLSVGYRLAPQSSFPAALIDALLAYLYLISPPPGAFHAAVPASRIVLTGDSSGGGLATSLALLLLTLPALSSPVLQLAGARLVAPPFAGLAMQSPWLDISRSMPSVQRNARFDILAPPSPSAMVPSFPPDAIWPASPPRVETYCSASMVAHPLVSPLAASAAAWRGANTVSVYICVGWEGMQDEAEVLARRLYQAGADVRFEGFVGMPHCFALLLPNASARRAWRGYAAFCREAVGCVEAEPDGREQREEENGKEEVVDDDDNDEALIEKQLGLTRTRTRTGTLERRTWGLWIDKHGRERRVGLDRMGLDADELGLKGRVPLDDEAVAAMMGEQRAWRLQRERQLVEEWRAGGGEEKQ